MEDDDQRTITRTSDPLKTNADIVFLFSLLPGGYVYKPHIPEIRTWELRKILFNVTSDNQTAFPGGPLCPLDCASQRARKKRVCVRGSVVVLFSWKRGLQNLQLFACPVNGPSPVKEADSIIVKPWVVEQNPPGDTKVPISRKKGRDCFQSVALEHVTLRSLQLGCGLGLIPTTGSQGEPEESVRMPLGETWVTNSPHKRNTHPGKIDQLVPIGTCLLVPMEMKPSPDPLAHKMPLFPNSTWGGT